MKTKFTSMIMVAVGLLCMITGSLVAQDSEPASSGEVGVLVPDVFLRYNPTHVGAPVGELVCAKIVNATDAIRDDNGNIRVILAVNGTNYDLVGSPIAGEPNSYSFCFTVDATWCGI